MGQRSNYSDLFFTTQLPVLEAIIMNEYDKIPDIVPEIFNVKSSNQWGEQSLTVAGIKPAVEKPEGDNTANDDPIDGYDKTYTHVTYAIKTSFTEELIEDNRLGLVGETYASLGLAAHQTKQVVCMNVFNNGFTDTGPDGSTLFATSHALIGGGTYANRPSTDIALSVAGIREMEVSMMRQVNHRSINVNLMPKCLWLPPELSQTGTELTKSAERPDTPNRAMNTFNGKYDMYVSPYFTSTTAWGALAAKGQHKLRFYDRVAPATKTWVDDNSGDVVTRIRMRFSVGYSDFIGTWGTTG